MTPTPTHESRPKAAPEAGWPTPMVLREALDEMADALGWYEAGVLHGIEMGRRQVEDEWRGRQAVSAAIARQIASAGPYAGLCEQRGEPERAQAQRDLLRRRGVTA